LLFILPPLKKIFDGEFYISEVIEYELVERPQKVKKFMLEALMIKKLIDEGVIKVKADNLIKKQTKVFLDIANNTFKANSEGIKIIHEGEASCLALYNFLPAEKKAIVVDERTLRMLCENPGNLHKLLENKLHRKIHANEMNYNFFRRFNIIRSTELAYMAHKNGIIRLPANPQKAIEAIFYALKYKGCSISHIEIKEAKNLI